MPRRSRTALVAASVTAVGTAIILSAFGVTAVQTAAQNPPPGQASAYKAPRAPDGTGKPNLNGIWQAMTTANWDIQDHSARKGPVATLGAAFSVPGGPGIVVGNELPYKPEALAKKKANAERWMTSDPEIKCYLPGVPRATYMPYPFQIVQTPSSILIDYEFAAAARIIPVNSKEKAPSDFWMGWSQAHWEGDTLVVDVTDLNEKTWFDRAGNYHSDALHVVERYTPVAADVLNYEATIEDPKVFTRSWKMSMPLYRHLEKNAQLFEYKCVEFAEELMWGPLNVTKPRSN